MPQLRFQHVRGVVQCTVGYTGGHASNPTYARILDHTEALMIEFDPRVTSYAALIQAWVRMLPVSAMKSTTAAKTICQYRCAVWYLTDEQRQTALQVFQAFPALKQGGANEWPLEPATRFYRAEEDHQDFLMKQSQQQSL
jgi:peptide-methionine (S)-S-oxide reductase